MVHMPIPINKANKIPDAKTAVDAEWQAHMDKKTWDVTKVRPKAEVIAETSAKNESVHFGYLRDLCHLKHAEFDPSLQKYKGRVVFRGDKVRDETGYFAVFTEQGASASQMSAAKFLDAIARMPRMSGQAADAVKAYTQVSLHHAHHLLGLPKVPGHMDNFSKVTTTTSVGNRCGPSVSVAILVQAILAQAILFLLRHPSS